MYAIIVKRDTDVSEKVIQRIKRIHETDTEQCLVVKTDKDLGRNVMVIHFDMLFYQGVREIEKMLGHDVGTKFDREIKRERELIEQGQTRSR